MGHLSVFYAVGAFDSSVLVETYTLTREASPALFAITMGAYLQYPQATVTVKYIYLQGQAQLAVFFSYFLLA